MQFIRQMVFYHLSMKKASRFSKYFIFRFCHDNSIKLLKIITGNLFLLPANSALDIFAVKSEKKKHPVKYDDAIYLIPIRLLLEKWNVFLPYKKRMLICKIDLFTRSWVPKKIKRTPIFLIHSLSASHMKRKFCAISRFFPLWDKFFCSKRLNFGFGEHCIEIYYVRTSGTSLFITGVRYKLIIQ